MKSPMYTTSTAIQRIQFSRSFRVIIHCAMRLVATSAASSRGIAAPGSLAVIVASANQVATPVAVSTNQRRRGVRVTNTGASDAVPRDQCHQP